MPFNLTLTIFLIHEVVLNGHGLYFWISNVNLSNLLRRRRYFAVVVAFCLKNESFVRYFSYSALALNLSSEKIFYLQKCLKLKIIPIGFC